jgi:GNAT superfamily N-acetyltransferase
VFGGLEIRKVLFMTTSPQTSSPGGRVALSDLQVRPVRDRWERRRFLLFPWRIYKHDPRWVPPVLSERAKRIDPERDPRFRRGEAELFVAWRGRRPVGTIGVAVDPKASTGRARPVVDFGFFECVNERRVADALLDRAVVWAKAHSAAYLWGPQSFGDSDEPGVLLEGRETPRGLMMGWTPPYYREYVEGYGFTTYRDALAYRVTLADYVDAEGRFEPPGGLPKIVARVRERYAGRYQLRPGDLDRWATELDIARTIYNRALGPLPHFYPMPRDEWQRMGASIRPLLDPDLALFLYLDEEPVRFALAMPDINTALLHCNGLRYPWDYLKLWWHSRNLPGLSFKIMAMVPEIHGLGLDALIYGHMVKTAWRQGFAWIDLSLTGDDNPTTNRLVERFGARLDKRYRIYQLSLSS